MQSFVMTLSQIIGALTVIIGAIVGVEKWTKGKISSWLLKPVIDKVDNLSLKFDKMELDQLKLIIMSDEIPIEERLQAGERYLEKGGNGAIKVHLHVLKEEYENLLKKGE